MKRVMNEWILEWMSKKTSECEEKEMKGRKMEVYEWRES